MTWYTRGSGVYGFKSESTLHLLNHQMAPCVATASFKPSSFKEKRPLHMHVYIVETFVYPPAEWSQARLQHFGAKMFKFQVWKAHSIVIFLLVWDFYWRLFLFLGPFFGRKKVAAKPTGKLPTLNDCGNSETHENYFSLLIICWCARSCKQRILPNTSAVCQWDPNLTKGRH